ncbi:AraC family transcriptional regulator [Paenibacillus sp. N3/727]|uniref:AraC family transcriptional regulator n=1 Tax=Paenibacillus sp. N3/727 TaxID=2925845 RepID=UPI001F530754|nr:AraC family transcriptional regulator [Paenibacillus sp. N3/727]UNK18876.1 AraC family transcriptional regulator [Paenibacillus sp. N3/727]
MTIDKTSLALSFKRANSVMNRSLNRIEQPELTLDIHYWGFMPQHFDNTEHKHSFFEACYVLTGHGSYWEGPNHYALSPGTLFLSKPGVLHSIKSDEGLSLSYVAFEPELSACSELYQQAFGMLAKQGTPVIQESLSQPPGMLWNSLISLFHHDMAYPPLALQSTALSLILSILVAHGPKLHMDSVDTEMNEEGASIVYQAELFIKDNLSEPLPLQRVANHLHITSRHLTRLFSKYGHQSFVHYVQEQRVQKAKSLLLNSDRQIKEIALICGFESVHYFTRVFTAKLGVTPARFRRSQFTEGRFDSNL